VVRHALCAVLCAALSVLVGCTPSEPSGSPSPEPSSPPSSPSATASAAVPVTLRFGVYGAPAELASYNKLARIYSVEHPEVTIEVQASRDLATAAQRLDQGFADGTAPDVFLMDHDLLPSYVRAGQVQPVDQLLEERDVLFGDNYTRLALEAFSADSALQCMPHDVSPLVVFYNTAMLHPRRLVTDDDQEPPSIENGWTWPQFALAAQQMSGDGVKGFYLPPTLETLAALVRSAGDDIVDDERLPTTLTFADDGTREALEEILAVARDTRLTPTPEQLQRQDAVTRFENGRLGMLVGTHDLVPRLREADGLSFDVFPLPNLGRPRTVAEMSGYCISAESAHVPAAADFLAFATSPEGARLTTANGSAVPVNLPVLHSDLFAQPGQQPANVQVFTDGVRRSTPMPFVPAWPEVVRGAQPLLGRLFHDPVLDLDRLLPRIDQRSEALLAPAG
jgi:multiple sugar transport system substrate-binding protein